MAENELFGNSEQLNDLISRQAAIGIVRKAKDKSEAHRMLVQLPSAQPTVDAVEVVRCRDCKNSEHWYADRRRCFLWHENGVSVFDGGFCNYGERKEGE